LFHWKLNKFLKMKKLLFLLVVGITSQAALSQTSDIEVKYLQLSYENNIVTIGDSIAEPDTTATLIVSFFVENVADADEIYLKIGSTDGGSDVKNLTYTVSLSGSDFIISEGGNDITLLNNIEAFISFAVLRSEESNWKFFEVSGKDDNGINCNTIKMNL